MRKSTTDWQRVLLLAMLLAALLPPKSSVQANPVLSAKDGSAEVDALARKAPAELNRNLNDYPTARFRDVTGHYVDYQGDRYFYLCGFLNLKNRFGGYRGWTEFMLSETFAPSHGVAFSTADNMADNDLIKQMCDDRSGGYKLKDYSTQLTYHSKN
jgi:hypothetical protein